MTIDSVYGHVKINLMYNGNARNEVGNRNAPWELMFKDHIKGPCISRRQIMSHKDMELKVNTFY